MREGGGELCPVCPAAPLQWRVVGHVLCTSEKRHHTGTRTTTLRRLNGRASIGHDADGFQVSRARFNAEKRSCRASSAARRSSCSRSPPDPVRTSGAPAEARCNSGGLCTESAAHRCSSRLVGYDLLLKRRQKGVKSACASCSFAVVAGGGGFRAGAASVPALV